MGVFRECPQYLLQTAVWLHAHRTPAGVPVRMMSPASRVITREQNAMSLGMLNSMLCVFAFCFSSPSTCPGTGSGGRAQGAS